MFAYAGLRNCIVDLAFFLFAALENGSPRMSLRIWASEYEPINGALIMLAIQCIQERERATSGVRASFQDSNYNWFVKIHPAYSNFCLPFKSSSILFTQERPLHQRPRSFSRRYDCLLPTKAYPQTVKQLSTNALDTKFSRYECSRSEFSQYA